MSFEQPQAPKEKIKNEYIDSSEMREVKEKYGQVIDDRDAHYQKMVEQNSDRGGMKDTLDVHNNIVLDYAVRLVDLDKSLSDKERAAAMIGTILHDGGKLDVPASETGKVHHELGVKVMDELSKKYLGQKIDGVEIDDEVIELAKNSIYRHMNHPYLVEMYGKFPEPETKVDEIVHNADMLANVGFKNFAFRFFTEKDINADLKKAEEKKITHIESALRNVIFDTMITNKDMRIKKDVDGGVDEHAYQILWILGENIGNLEHIFFKMKDGGVFEQIQQELGVEKITMANRSQAIARLNEEIIKAGQGLRMPLDMITLQNYKI